MKNLKFRIFLIAASALFFLVNFSLIGQKTYAQTTAIRIKSIINISPIIIDTTLQKGKNQTYTFKLTNLLNEPLGIRADVEDFIPYDTQEPPNSTSISSPIVTWSSLDQENIIINPKEKKAISLTVKTPPDVKDGGYYEAVFFTPIYLKTDPNDPKNVVSRIGALFFGTVGKINYNDLKNKVRVSNLKLGPVFENSHGQISFAVNNSYFNHFSAKPFLRITPLFGNQQRIVLTDKKVLPGKGRTWNENFEVQSPHHIVYLSRLEVSVGQGNYVYANSIFFIFPIKIVLALLLGITLILILIFRGKSLKRAAMVLFSGK